MPCADPHAANRSTGAFIVIDEAKLKRIKIIPVKTIIDVVDEMIDWKGKEKTRARFNSKKRITL